MPATRLTYALVTAARNEDKYIENTIRSVVAQTILPVKWIIVSDGSIDQTDEIVKRYVALYNWIELLRMPEHRDRQFAAKAGCFKAGYALLKDLPFDIIGNIDADITFAPDYFEFLLGKFATVEHLGVGGTPYAEDAAHPEHHSCSHASANLNYVSGPCQLFKRECFDEIGGYPAIKGGAIDWVAVTTARMKGWVVRCFVEKTYFHHRPMGTANSTPLQSRFHYGKKAYYVGGHPLWEFLRSIFQMKEPPYLLAGSAFFAGYCWGFITRMERPVSPEVMAFHRREQMARLRGILREAMTGGDHICVCLCTFKRPDWLKRLLVALEKQETGGKFTYSVVVADNDGAESSRTVIEEFSKTSPLKVTYCVESRKNIALARNATLARAEGNFIAFVDDDEFPVPQWLQLLLAACEKYKADCVLGPVRPHFENPPPNWIIKGRFCERPEHPTGTRIDWDEGRTGNLLIRRSLVENATEPFDPKFGNGGEDKDFFLRMDRLGRVFIWCNEAIIYETVPPARCTRGYMLKRALLRGKNILKLPTGRARLLVTSMIAVPLYSIALPVLLLFGQHRFMQYCIKLCDHVGRLLAVAGLNPINERSG